MENKYAIYSNNLSKKFVSYKKASGFKGSVKSIFNREYQEKYAVNGFNLEIEKGKIIGLLGPNGAGKTTLMKMFTGIIVPSDGELQVLGKNPWERDKGLRKKNSPCHGTKISTLVIYPLLIALSYFKNITKCLRKNLKLAFE